jgi:hypothetical protein
MGAYASVLFGMAENQPLPTVSKFRLFSEGIPVQQPGWTRLDYPPMQWCKGDLTWSPMCQGLKLGNHAEALATVHP